MTVYTLQGAPIPDTWYSTTSRTPFAITSEDARARMAGLPWDDHGLPYESVGPMTDAFRAAANLHVVTEWERACVETEDHLSRYRRVWEYARHLHVVPFALAHARRVTGYTGGVAIRVNAGWLCSEECVRHNYVSDSAVYLLTGAGEPYGTNDAYSLQDADVFQAGGRALCAAASLYDTCIYCASPIHPDGVRTVSCDVCGDDTPADDIAWTEWEDEEGYDRAGDLCESCVVTVDCERQERANLCPTCGESHTDTCTIEPIDDELITFIGTLTRSLTRDARQGVIWSEDEIRNGTAQMELAI